MFLKIITSAVMMFVATSLATSTSFADQMGPGGDKFYEEAARFENACAGKIVCDLPYVRKVVYDQSTRLNKLSENDKLTLKAVSFAQAQIWGDTILEGDFHAAGRTRLDYVVAHYKGDQLLGYKIQYSEKAWYTGDCSFDGSRASLKDCVEGRIIEGSYVSPDLQTYFSDEDRYAKFSSPTL